MNPPAEFAAWLACAGFALLFLNQALTVWGKLMGKKTGTEITPQPLDVRLVAEFARREECAGRHEAAQERIASIEKNMENFGHERAEDARTADAGRKAIYEHINDLRRELTDKIDSMPSLIVAQLTNTKQLWKK